MAANVDNGEQLGNGEQQGSALEMGESQQAVRR